MGIKIAGLSDRIAMTAFIFKNAFSHAKNIFRESNAMMLLMLLCAFTSQSVAREVKDLALGVALYEFFQQNDFSALSEILVAEETERLENQQDYASQFAAGIMLSYGMDEAAVERLKQNEINGFIDEENQARSNYYLGKLVYRKGKYQQAQTLLQSIDKNLSEELKPELAFLLHSSLVRGNGDAASSVSQTNTRPAIKRDDQLKIWNDYLQYNRSVASENVQIAAVETVSVDALERLASKVSAQLRGLASNKKTERYQELLALRDRALLSASYLHLNAGNPDSAIKHLRAYSANGLEHDDALLAYGWAHLQKEDFDKALTAWGLLSSGDIGSATTREALLGIAHLYERQANVTLALSTYNDAIARFQDELLLLSALEQQAQKHSFAGFLQALENNTLNWLEDYDIDAIANVDQEHTSLLYRLKDIVPRDDFIALINQRRDIAWLQRADTEWREIIIAIDSSLENQRQRFAQVFDEDYQQALAKQRSELQRAYEVSKKTLEALGEDDHGGLDNSNRYIFSMSALMSADEQAQYLKAKQLNQKLADISDKLRHIRQSGLGKDEKSSSDFAELDQKTDTRKQTARLLSGSMLWNIALEKDRREWSMSKQLGAIQAALEESAGSINEIESLVPEQASQSESSQKIAGLAQRRSHLSHQIQAHHDAVDAHIYGLIASTLDQQADAVKSYLAQAQLAKARLLDGLFMSADADFSSQSSVVETNQ